MIDENGDTTSLNGDQRRTTQLNIEKSLEILRTLY